MHSSWRLARSSLAGKRGRTALIIGAVALAASLVAAVSCTIQSIQASLEVGLSRIIGAAEARIIHQFHGRFDSALLEEVRSWPEVELATGRLTGSLTLIHADRRKDPETGELIRATPTAMGVDFDLQDEFRRLEIIDGVMPTAPEELLIDPFTAAHLQAEVGDTLIVQRFGPPMRLTVAGIYQRKALGAIQRPRIRIDWRTLGEATGTTDQLTGILMTLRDGADVERVCAAYRPGLADQLELEPADMVRTGFDRRIMASRAGLIIASVLTFMGAAFIIVTGLTTAVTEKQRELAMVRAIGGSRRQLVSAQLLLGLIVGATGGAIGIPLGIGFSGLLVWWFRDLLPAGLHVHPLGIRLAILGAIAAGTLGAVYPAWMAGRVSPLSAMAAQAQPVRARNLAAAAGLGFVLVGLQLALLWPSDVDLRFWSYAYVGAPLVYLGYFILAVPLFALVTLAIGPLLGKVSRLPAGMLRRSLLGTPFRHGFTAGALMVGMAVLVNTWSNAISLLDDWIGRIKFADGFAYRTTGISPEQQDAIASLPFVEATCPIGYLPLRVIGQQVFGVSGVVSPNVICVGFDPELFFSINNVDWIQGDPATATRRLQQGDGVLVADRFLTARNIGVGDRIRLGAGRVEKEFEIVGVIGAGGLEIATHLFGIRSQYLEYAVSCVFMDFDRVVEHFDNRDAYMLQVNLADGITDDEVSRRIEEAAPGVIFRSGRWIMDTINGLALALLTVQSTIAFAALMLASLGVGNVIIANIYTRRFEYGVLRALGAPRSFLVRLIASEATLLAVTAILIGTVLGLHLAWVANLFYRDLAGIRVSLTVPVGAAVAGGLVLAAMTLLASVPGLLSVIRPPPSRLLAPGRTG
ncbi:MAG: FtsX-like permease family protein [Planctomycetota bacterium]|jgi:putative ABC transport system permease protein